MVQRLLHASGRSTSARFMISSRDFATVGGIDYAALWESIRPFLGVEERPAVGDVAMFKDSFLRAQREPHAGRGRHRWGPPRQRDAAL